MPEKELVRHEERDKTDILTLDDPPANTCPHQMTDPLDAAISKANQTISGLAAGIWTRVVGSAHRVASQIQDGTAWINTYNQYDSGSPFRGYKHTASFGAPGREAALAERTQVKSVWVALDR